MSYFYLKKEQGISNSDTQAGQDRGRGNYKAVLHKNIHRNVKKETPAIPAQYCISLPRMVFVGIQK